MPVTTCHHSVQAQTQYHKRAGTNYLWNLWNNCSCSPPIPELCIICFTLPVSCFLLFHSSNGRKDSAGPDSYQGWWWRPIWSPWKYLERPLKTKHFTIRGENPPRAVRVCVDRCAKQKLYLGFNTTVVTGPSHLEQLGLRSDVREMERCHHPFTPVYPSVSAAPAPGKNAPSFPLSLWRQFWGIIRPSPKPIPFKWHYS